MTRRVSMSLVPVALAALGLVMVFHAPLLSGLRLMQTEPTDTRFINYTLEQETRALGFGGRRPDLWSPPIFYPEPNTAAYSDILVALVPFYAPWRLAGFLPDTAFQLWTLTVALLNYFVFWRFLRKVFWLGQAASSLGAFLFAYGAIRVAQLNHPQLLPHFYSVIAVWACMQLFSSDERARAPRTWIPVLFVSVVLQLWAGFYLGWFLVFFLAVGALWGLLLDETRGPFLRFLRQNALLLLVSALLSALAILPLARHYLAAAGTVGLRTFGDAAVMLVPLKAWLYHGPWSWLYGRTAGWPLFAMPMDWEKALGLGLITPLVVASGLLAERRRVAVQVVLLTSLSAVLAVTILPGGESLWRLVYQLIPGAAAIRAVARIGLVLLIPAAIGLALAVERMSARGARWSVVVVGAVVMLEQGHSMPSYVKADLRADVQAVVQSVPQGGACEAFYFCVPDRRKPAWQSHLDAMWAQLERPIPTVNGYSGNLPPGFVTLGDNLVDSADDEPRIRQWLADWMGRHGRDASRVCVVKAR